MDLTGVGHHPLGRRQRHPQRLLGFHAGQQRPHFDGQCFVVLHRIGDERLARAAWWYPTPNHRFDALRDHLALYPGRVDQATVDGEVVEAQEGDFYGGWITSRVTGPFKGAPGTWGW